MVDVKSKQAPAREPDLRTQIENLLSEVHQLQNYFAQREAYTCSTYLNQQDETIEEDKMANIKLALDSLQVELDVIAEHVNMDQPLASHASTPPHDTFPIYTRCKNLVASWSRTTSLLGWRKRNRARATWHTTCRAEKLIGAFMPTDDLYGRKQTQNNFLDYGKESRKVKKKRPRPYIRVRSTTLGPKPPAFAALRNKKPPDIETGSRSIFRQEPKSEVCTSINHKHFGIQAQLFPASLMDQRSKGGRVTAMALELVPRDQISA
jgi:hypothetical protein